MSLNCCEASAVRQIAFYNEARRLFVAQTVKPRSGIFEPLPPQCFDYIEERTWKPPSPVGFMRKVFCRGKLVRTETEEKED